MASDALSVIIVGTVRKEFGKICLKIIFVGLLPMSRAASTKGSCFMRRTSDRTMRKYCGTNTTVIAHEAERIPEMKSDFPPEIMIETKIAIKRDGKE